MIREGTQAPSFELPAVVSGQVEQVVLEEFLGDSVIILAFYPADFNPMCTGESTDLDGFDVFSMQQDAVVLGICGDSIYSHHAFAERYSLTIPLLSDVDGVVADAYGVPEGDGGYPTERAVVVIDHDGVVVYTWAANEIDELPKMADVQAAFSSIGDAALAETAYEEGCATYDTGRDAFVAGLEAYERREWVMATSSFEQALASLEETRTSFETAVRFSETEANERSFEFGLHAVSELERAVKLFAKSTAAHANRKSRQAQELRAEAEAVLETVREIGAPPEPDEVPIDVPLEEASPDGEVELEETEEVVPTEETAAGLEFDGDVELKETDEFEPTDETKPEWEPDKTAESEVVGEDASIDDEEIDALTAEIEDQDSEDDESDAKNWQ